jgi:hypothetical protein
MVNRRHELRKAKSQSKEECNLPASTPAARKPINKENMNGISGLVRRVIVLTVFVRITPHCNQLQFQKYPS